jgi:phospholipid/cholesterol/gamma-HCH transport system permease protein
VAAPSAPGRADRALRGVERVGRTTLEGLANVGFGASLLWQSAYWLVMGRRRRQVVRAAPIFSEMMEIGIRALPIVSVLSMTIGIMLAIQGIDALEKFGAQHQVVIGVALSVTREFGPLITAILVAGRSGSALAARLGTMTINEEVDALQVMGINPVRFLVVPSLIAMLVMLPALTIWSDLLGLLGAGFFATAELGTTLFTWFDDTLRVLEVGDVLHGLFKSAIFAVLITLVGVVNGASVTGGAEGVGRVTTRSVVQAISAIVLTDMIFVFAVTR